MPGFPAPQTPIPLRLRQFPRSACSRPPLPGPEFSFRYNHSNAREVRCGVIGAGHAGCEAAAPARAWVSGQPWSPELDLVAQMSCNPHRRHRQRPLVREIDASAASWANSPTPSASSSGSQHQPRPAVWSPRAQMDKKMYRLVCANSSSRSQPPDQAGRSGGAYHSDRRVTAFNCGWPRYRAGAVIVTPHLSERLAHVGEMQYTCGRNGEAPRSCWALNCAPSVSSGPVSRLERRHASMAAPSTGASSNRSRRCRADAILVPHGEDRRAQIQCHIGYTTRKRGGFCWRHPAFPAYSARSRASVRAIARPSKTRSSSFPISRVTRFFLNRGLDTTSIRNGMSPACH